MEIVLNVREVVKIEMRKVKNTIEIKHEATISDETEVAIVFGDGTKRIVKVPFETYAQQRLGIYIRGD